MSHHSWSNRVLDTPRHVLGAHFDASQDSSAAADSSSESGSEDSVDPILTKAVGAQLVAHDGGNRLGDNFLWREK